MNETQATIPADVMEAAREIVGVNHRWIGPSEVAILAARAIIAERERCAKIAEGNMLEADDGEEPGDDDWWTRSAANGQATAIAAAIRQSKESR